MEDGFEVVCQQVVVFLSLFGDHPPCRAVKRIQVSFSAGANQLSQQLAVRHRPYAALINGVSRLPTGGDIHAASVFLMVAINRFLNSSTRSMDHVTVVK